jgi:hypothetical protein
VVTGYCANTVGCGGVSVGNKANNVGGVAGVYVMSDAVDMGAGDASSVAVGTDKASFVAKQILPSRWQERFAFLGVHVNAPMRSAVRAKSYLSSPTPKNLSRIRFLRMFYCTRAKIP